MDIQFRLPKLRQFCRIVSSKWLILVGAVAIGHLLFHLLVFPYGYTISSLLPTNMDRNVMIAKGGSSIKPLIARNALAVDSSSSGGVLKIEVVVNNYHKSNHGVEGNGGVSKRGFASEEDGLDYDGDDHGEFAVDRDVVDDDNNNDDVLLMNVIDGNEVAQKRSSTTEFAGESKSDVLVKQNVTTKNFRKEKDVSSLVIGPPIEVVPEPPSSMSSTNNSARVGSPVKKKMKCEMPPKSITTFDEMDRLLAKHRRSSRAMRPRRSSVRDKEILAARSEIQNAAVLVNDRDLYAPAFRNVSQFKRSYELMERTLKVYIYKDGKKPIYHLPILKGLYASEGWFMKLMQGSQQFLTKDPRKAHLFYMPFSSRMLEHTLYVRNSHNRTNLRQHLKEYTDTIAAKYPYWNRTGGADHFLVACHDWAPYETRHHMEHCIKALCNADVTAGFKIGRDVSLPETYVRAATNPLRDLGGKPASERRMLAFYAGSMHGYLRRILIKHWKDKDPDMNILGRMPLGVASKMSYIQHMKSSKYCICPKGYEVNSPRIVESIFYECVPVIISDNFVPPLFEVFNWSAFSIILPEKDIPNLKEILLSIPGDRYIELQLGVRKVQRHFLWHAKPVKYDLFHMTLHSIWYNRVHQIKPR